VASATLVGDLSNALDLCDSLASERELIEVAVVNRPTFDMSILRALLDPVRAGHDDALRLLGLAADGVLEVAVPPEGVRADLRSGVT